MAGRFAPTPSGRMHIGNVFAMVAAWLSSRSQHDSIYLRIEDIDQPRVIKDADRWIMDDLDWLGLDWDGDPVYQSHRLDLYASVFHKLCEVHQPLLYPCFCSRAEIRAASAPQEGDGFTVYPGTCRVLATHNMSEVKRRLHNHDRHSWRLAVPPVDSASAIVSFEDRVFGTQQFNLAVNLGDTVMRRSDGLFAYQFVVTLDDLLMGVTDIVRGRDLLRSTALQLYLRQNILDSQAISSIISDVKNKATHIHVDNSEECISEQSNKLEFAHIPLLDNAVGVRLAKRERSLDLGALRTLGVRPEQIIGYCAWALGLIEKPQSLTAQDALAIFSWDHMRVQHTDICVPDDVVEYLLEL